MKRFLLDANVVIRFLRGDHPDHFQRSKALFEQAEKGSVRLILLESVFAEIVFVLSSVYDIPRQRISDALQPLLFHAGIECRDSKILFDALQRWCAKNVDFMDALLAAHALDAQIPVASFDKDFRKFPDVHQHLP